MGQLDASERPPGGAMSNTVKEARTGRSGNGGNAANSSNSTRLDAETLDVTMPGDLSSLGHVHPLNGTIDRGVDIFVGLGCTVSGANGTTTSFCFIETTRP